MFEDQAPPVIVDIDKVDVARIICAGEQARKVAAPLVDEDFRTSRAGNHKIDQAVTC